MQKDESTLSYSPLCATEPIPAQNTSRAPGAVPLLLLPRLAPLQHRLLPCSTDPAAAPNRCRRMPAPWPAPRGRGTVPSQAAACHGGGGARSAAGASARGRRDGGTSPRFSVIFSPENHTDCHGFLTDKILATFPRVRLTVGSI